MPSHHAPRRTRRRARALRVLPTSPRTLHALEHDCQAQQTTYVACLKGRVRELEGGAAAYAVRVRELETRNAQLTQRLYDVEATGPWSRLRRPPPLPPGPPVSPPRPPPSTTPLAYQAGPTCSGWWPSCHRATQVLPNVVEGVVSVPRNGGDDDDDGDDDGDDDEEADGDDDDEEADGIARSKRWTLRACTGAAQLGCIALGAAV